MYFFPVIFPPPPVFFTVNDETKIFGFNLEIKDNCRETMEGCGSVAETHPAWQSPAPYSQAGDRSYGVSIVKCDGFRCQRRLLEGVLNHSLPALLLASLAGERLRASDLQTVPSPIPKWN